MLEQLLLIIELCFALSSCSEGDTANFITKAVDDLSAMMVHI